MIFVSVLFVMPKFVEIFKDFKTEMPPATLKLVRLSDFMEQNLWIAVVLLALLLLVLLMILARSLRFTFTPWWPQLALGTAARWVGECVPWVRNLSRWRAMADICLFIADAIRAGVPLPDALIAAAALDMPPPIRDSLMQWRTGLLLGAPIPEAAARAGMPRVLVGFLEASFAPGREGEPQTLAALFDFVGRYYRDRFSRLAVMLRSLLEPAMTVALGFIVLQIVLAIFTPLMVLLNSVMEYPGGVL
jgi:type II secretory pathway component PulF